MNREEAIVYVIKKIMEEKPDNLHIAVTALRGPQPDPITGLMPCGCGGKAEMSVETNETNWTQAVSVTCRECGIRIGMAAFAEQRGTEALADDAIDGWNTAMSGRGRRQ